MKKVCLVLLALLLLTACAERPPEEVDCIITISQGRMVIIRPAGEKECNYDGSKVD